MIIKGLCNNTGKTYNLSLTKTRLRQMTQPQEDFDQPFYLLLADVEDGRIVPLREKSVAPDEGTDYGVPVFMGLRTIGCTKFDQKTWALIAKAIKAAKGEL